MVHSIERLRSALAGRYDVERMLGDGGMATVYLARDPRHERLVALKVLRPELTAVVGVERFLLEIRTLASLQHPHILPLLDSGETDGIPFFVMPYLAGESLRARLAREKQLPLEDALRIAVEVAEALEYAHRREIVHRDVKPENVLFSEGHAIVADFGIARAVRTAGGERLTTIGAVLGTPAYMSPEQSSGSDDLDGRSDVYSLGCVLYEMLAGEPPFTGATAESVAYQHLSVPPRPVTEKRSAVPTTIAAVLQRVLAKAPADRYPSAASFAQALVGASAFRGPLGPADEREPAGRQRRKRLIVAVVTGAALLATLTVLYLNVWRERMPPTGGPAIRSLAVLPLENLSGDPSQEYFADGMTEELITTLSQVSALRVISRTSTMKYKGAHKTVPEIGRELRVAAVIEGSVQREGKRVRVTAQLIRTADDQHLWAEAFDRDVRDVLSMQAEVANAITRRIAAAITPLERSRLARVRTVNPAAHDAYLRGRYYWSKRTGDDIVRAVGYFQQAIALDSTYAAAYAGLADCYNVIGSEALKLSISERAWRQRVAATRALALDDQLAEAHVTLADVMLTADWDWAGAEREFRRAIELDPGYAVGHQRYAFLLGATGRLDEALSENQRALDLDPFFLASSLNRAWLFHYSRRNDLAIEQCYKTLELNPEWRPPVAELALVYAQGGNYAKAIDWAKRADSLAHNPDQPLTKEIRLRSAVAQGRRGEAARIYASLKPRLAREADSEWVPRVHIAMGNADDAIESLTKGCDVRAFLALWLKQESAWDPLRSDPRFQQLVRRVGIP